MPKYRTDPRWTLAKFAQKCMGDKGKCAQAIKVNDRIFWYPTERLVLAQPCGHADAASKDFSSHTADEGSY